MNRHLWLLLFPRNVVRLASNRTSTHAEWSKQTTAWSCRRCISCSNASIQPPAVWCGIRDGASLRPTVDHRRSTSSDGRSFSNAWMCLACLSRWSYSQADIGVGVANRAAPPTHPVVMLSIRFSSITLPADDSSSPSESIIITPTEVCCGTQQFATFLSSMWIVGGHYFTAGEIAGPVVMTFRGPGELRVGPYPAVRLVGQSLFIGGEMLARVDDDKWRASADGQDYEAVVFTQG